MTKAGQHLAPGHAWRKWRPPTPVPDAAATVTRYCCGLVDRIDMSTIVFLALLHDGNETVRLADILTERGIRINTTTSTVTAYYRDSTTGHVYRGTAPVDRATLAWALEIGRR